MAQHHGNADDLVELENYDELAQTFLLRNISRASLKRLSISAI